MGRLGRIRIINDVNYANKLGDKEQPGKKWM